MSAKTSSLVLLSIQEVLDQDIHPQEESLVVPDSIEGTMFLVLLSTVMTSSMMLKLETIATDVYKQRNNSN
jgi:hypothetical protein